MSDLSHVLIHHTNDWCINSLCQRADTKLILCRPARLEPSSGHIPVKSCTLCE